MPKAVRCPTCREVAPWDGNPHRPFCSERCRTRDLGAWAEERYRLPVVDEDGEVYAEDDEP